MSFRGHNVAGHDETAGKTPCVFVVALAIQTRRVILRPSRAETSQFPR
jgi:hypothetical protein